MSARSIMSMKLKSIDYCDGMLPSFSVRSTTVDYILVAVRRSSSYGSWPMSLGASSNVMSGSMAGSLLSGKLAAAASLLCGEVTAATIGVDYTFYSSMEISFKIGSIDTSIRAI